jgi:carbon monoxide dehydrogenase subunit G
VGSQFDVSYSGSYRFDAPPAVLWRELGRVDRFEDWWPWMRDVMLVGDALAPGSIISFGIDPPVPFRMHISVFVTESQAPHLIRGDVSGDLKGKATLQLEGEGDRSLCRVTWEVEIANTGIRRVIHIARPILLWAQRWAVEIALKGFRAHLRRL